MHWGDMKGVTRLGVMNHLQIEKYNVWAFAVDDRLVEPDRKAGSSLGGITVSPIGIGSKRLL